MVVDPTLETLNLESFSFTNGVNDEDRDEDEDDTPETPLDEPRPPKVEDPPSEPDEKGPYVVRGSASATRA
jgi:hypothetical protein